MKTCRKGLHQYVEDKGCPQCKKNYTKDWIKKNKDRVSLHNNKFRENNKESIKIAKENSHRKKPHMRSARAERYRKSNLAMFARKYAKRRCEKIKRTPKWLNAEHKKQILSTYYQSKLMTQHFGIDMHVDHIVPLKGKEVSGLHVPWNLQVIPKLENIRKHNKFIQGEPS